METEFGQQYYKEFIESLGEESTTTFIQRYPNLVEEIVNEFKVENLQFATFGKLSLTKLTYGRFAIPAAAALITATSRARLLAIMKGLDAVYWDTDSVFIKDYNPVTANEKLKVASSWLPPFLIPLRIGEELGELDCELENATGYLAGTKRYYLSDKEGYVKKALHGIPTAPWDKAGEMIENLATGKNIKYTGRGRPKGVKETKDVNEIGRFGSRDFESQFHLDERLNWVETELGWMGEIKNITDQ